MRCVEKTQRVRLAQQPWRQQLKKEKNTASIYASMALWSEKGAKRNNVLSFIGFLLAPESFFDPFWLSTSTWVDTSPTTSWLSNESRLTSITTGIANSYFTEQKFHSKINHSPRLVTLVRFPSKRHMGNDFNWSTCNHKFRIQTIFHIVHGNMSNMTKSWV